MTYSDSRIERRRAALQIAGASALLLVAIGLTIYVQQVLGIDLMDTAIIRSAIESAGMWGPAIYIGLLALTVVVSHLPGVPLTVAAGAIWGVAVGAGLSVIGATIGAMIDYAIGRGLGSNAVERVIGYRIEVRPGLGRRKLAAVIGISRLIPFVPFDIVSYAAGIARVPVGAFLIPTVFGMIPPTLLMTYAGEQVPNAMLWGLVLSAAAFLAAIVLPLTRRRTGRSPVDQVFEITRRRR